VSRDVVVIECSIKSYSTSKYKMYSAVFNCVYIKKANDVVVVLCILSVIGTGRPKLYFHCHSSQWASGERSSRGDGRGRSRTLTFQEYLRLIHSNSAAQPAAFTVGAEKCCAMLCWLLFS